jgi:dihydrolipoamide dehydrogenase
MEYDVIIIGSGPGGYVAGIRAGQLGLRVLVVDKKYLGGTCLNVGCIPTKTLLHISHVIEQNRKFKKNKLFDIEIDSLNLTNIRDFKNSIVNRLKKGIESLFKANNVEFIMGSARLVDPNTCEITKDNGEKVYKKSKNFIIATGSEPIILKGFEYDKEFVWTSDDALDLKRIPGKLLILGAGAIGLEFGYIYKMLGSEVEIIELMPQILPGSDTEMARELEKILKRKGIKIYTSARAKELKKKERGIELKVEIKGKEVVMQGDVLLLSVGRKPNSKGIGIEELEVETDEKGFIKVDKRRRTNIDNIYAIGDVTEPPLLAHKASREGIVAVEVIKGYKSEFDSKAIPSVVYTFPEFASCGITEEEAREMGIEVKIGKFPLIGNARSLAYGESQGMAKIIADAETDEILGVHIIAPEASSLIGEGVLAIEMGSTAEDVGLTVHPHPSLSEILMEAAENVHKRAIHTINK